MSKYLEFGTTVRDPVHLIRALAIMGFRETETHETAQPLVGYQGDERTQTAHVIVRRHYVGQASNDIGFLRGEDGTYSAIISRHDRYRFNNAWLGHLKQEYSLSRVTATLQAKGCVGISFKTENGKIKIRAMAR